MTTQPATTTGLFQRLWNDSALRTVVPIFLVLRILTLVLAFWTVKMFPPPIDWDTAPIHYLHDMAIGVGSESPLYGWLEPWFRWDTGWYINAAVNGFQANNGTIIYAPIYPLSIRGLGALLGGQYLVASLLLSNFACFMALIFLYKIVEEEFGSSIARNSLVLYMVFPSAFFMLAGYTESPFLVFLFASWYALRHEKFILAGLLAILCSLSRSQGWALMFPFAYISFIEPMRRSPAFRGTIWDYAVRLFAVLGGAIGTMIYLGCMSLSGLGNVNDAYFRYWDVKILPPWTTIAHAVQLFVSQPITFGDVISLITLVFFLVAGVLVTKRLKPEYWLYFWATFVFLLMRSYEPTTVQAIIFIAIVRYSLTLFPAFIALALYWEEHSRLRNYQRWAYILGAAGLQIVFVVMFTAGLWVA